MNSQIIQRITLLVLVLYSGLTPRIDSDPKQPAKTPVQYRLRQIMMDAAVSSRRDAEIRKLAETVLVKASSGGDFAALAKRYSQEPGAGKTGGDLGFFTRSQMVKPFSDAVFAMKPGEIRGLVKTQYGYHIINLIAINGDKRHARHILFMLTPDRADSMAVLGTLASIRNRLLGGERFETLFARYNTYDTLTDTDGYMVWQKPGDMLPDFANAVMGLDTGEISRPFVSVIGFHIVLVDSINYNPGKLLKGFPPYIEERLKNKNFKKP